MNVDTSGGRDPKAGTGTERQRKAPMGAMMRSGMTISAAAIAFAGLTVGGCSPPQGASGGRVETTDTTRAERYSTQVLPASLVEFSDQVAQQLAADLSEQPELNRDFRVSVVFGDIVNKTGIVPTSDFEAFRTRVRQKLMQSPQFRDKVRFIESRARWSSVVNRELGGSGNEDLLQEGSRTGNSRGLNPEYTYFLNGEMYRVERGGRTNLYLMSFNLMKASDSELVWESSPYEVKQDI